MTFLQYIFHANSNRLFQLGMRENVKIFVTDCLEDDAGNLMGRHASLHRLAHELHHRLTVGTHALFSRFILELDWTIASRIHNLCAHKTWTEDRDLNVSSPQSQFVVERLGKRDDPMFGYFVNAQTRT